MRDLYEVVGNLFNFCFHLDINKFKKGSRELVLERVLAGVRNKVLVVDATEPDVDIGYMGLDCEMMENGVSLTRDETMGPGYMGNKLECQVESMMVGVSREEEPHHHGGVITLVQGPTTIPENGGEGGLVLGGHTTGGHEHEKDLEMGIKYCPGLEVTLPRYKYV